jgi:hypothetical protein
LSGLRSFIQSFGVSIVNVKSAEHFNSVIGLKNNQLILWKRNNADVTESCKDELSRFSNKEENVKFDVEVLIPKNGTFSAEIFFKDQSETLRRFQAIIDDMNSLVDGMRLACNNGDTLACRLAVISGIRCPKWHEDHVDLRLIKSYYGDGTEWINPNDNNIRFIHFVRSSVLGLDIDNLKRRDIHQCEVGDALIIPGKRRRLKVPRALPVLHRSPIVSPSSRRLLFTVTINHGSPQ